LPAFERVVEDGTAKEAQVAGLRVAGKTGTALKAARGGYSGKSEASFVGFFPADDPKVALIVLLDEPRTSIYGGTVAAPVFQRVAERWIGTFPALSERVAAAAQPLEPAERNVPAVAGQPAAVAIQRLMAEGWRMRPPTRDAALRNVAAQQPLAAAPASPQDKIQLTLAPPDTSAAVMPDVTGLSARQAVFWLAARGVEVQLEGHGTVQAQVPAAGSSLPSRAVLRCR
jgi:cell division protein FtsI (penicillin-binding protein 3)